MGDVSETAYQVGRTLGLATYYLSVNNPATAKSYTQGGIVDG